MIFQMSGISRRLIVQIVRMELKVCFTFQDLFSLFDLNQSHHLVI